MSSRKNSVIKYLDWWSVILYFLLVAVGWCAIFSSTYKEDMPLSINSFYFKQLVFIAISAVMILFLLALDIRFYERFAGVLYLISMLSLIGLFILGKKTNGALAWYSIGSITIQPSEFAKVATALLFAKQLSRVQLDIRKWKDLLEVLLWIAIPSFLILLQPDVGSVLVFFSFILVLYREGMRAYLLWIILSIALIFILTLKFGVALTSGIITIVVLLLMRKGRRRQGISKRTGVLILLLSVLFSLSTSYVFNNVFKQHHRDRIGIWLRLNTEDNKSQQFYKTKGYNSFQSESTIASGGFTGKGFLQGTRTKGDFVPEQRTDYIFTNIGEEWGFLGSIAVVFLFSGLLLRVWILSERQKLKFNRIYGYCVVSILFAHFAINIGMVIGLVPTVGIPLPFFSYGGSGLLAFTILLFIFLSMDAHRNSAHDRW